MQSINQNNTNKDVIKIILKEKYDIRAKKIEKNMQSTEGNVYIIYCKDKKYVIKIYNDIKHTKRMVQLHRKLEQLEFNIPKIIGYEEIVDNNFMVIYSFIEGEQIRRDTKTEKFNESTIIKIAKELNRLHKNMNENEYNLPKIPFADEGNRQSFLHFDLTKNNIFIYNNQIGFIDFDDAKYGDSICDIAILVTNLFFSKNYGFDKEGMKKFIDEYYGEDSELKDKEILLIKKYALSWIDYVLNGHEFDTSTTESFEIKKKLIKENL